MKTIALIIFIFYNLSLFSQSQKKEIVYLLFEANKEECLIEDGSGNYRCLNKYRKEYDKDIIRFRICDELFTFHRYKGNKDTCSIKALDNLKLVDFDYLVKKYDSVYEFKHHVFEKIYFIERISKDKIIKYEVGWIDEIIMIED